MSRKGEDARLAYLQQMVEGASREDLLLMLLDGALRFTNQAEVAFDGEVWDEVHNLLCRVQDIFNELMITLDGDLGDVAVKLSDIYGFINNLLIEANIDHNRESLMQAKGLIIDVKKMWEDAIERAGGAGGQPMPPDDGSPPGDVPKSINVTG